MFGDRINIVYKKKSLKRPLVSEAKWHQLQHICINIPPTSDSARYHSYRVYYQVQTWIGNTLNPQSRVGY